MGQYAILLVIAALLTGGGFLINAQRHTGAAQEATALYSYDSFAREAAQVGLERVGRNLVRQPSAWSGGAAAMDALFGVSGTHTRGGHSTPYDVEIVAVDMGTPPANTQPVTDPDRVEVVATGTANGTVHVVRAVYERGYTNVGTPPAFRYAIAADDDLDLQGSIHIAGSIHTNQRLESTGDRFSITGTATYTGSWDGDNTGRYSGGVAQSERVDIPPIPMPPAIITRQQNAPVNKQGRVTGPYTMSASDNPGTAVSNGWYGVTGKGTAAAPYILFVNGDLTVSGDVRLPGHVRIYVTGNFSMGSNSKLSQIPPAVSSGTFPGNDATDAQVFEFRDQRLPEGNTIGLYVGGRVEMDGTPFLAAQLYSEGDVVYRGGGTKMILGGVVSRGQIVVQGTPKVYYTRAGAPTYDPGLNLMQPDGLVLVSYREWSRRPADP